MAAWDCDDLTEVGDGEYQRVCDVGRVPLLPGEAPNAGRARLREASARFRREALSRLAPRLGGLLVANSDLLRRAGAFQNASALALAAIAVLPGEGHPIRVLAEQVLGACLRQESAPMAREHGKD